MSKEESDSQSEYTDEEDIDLEVPQFVKRKPAETKETPKEEIKQQAPKKADRRSVTSRQNALKARQAKSKLAQDRAQKKKEIKEIKIQEEGSEDESDEDPEFGPYAYFKKKDQEKKPRTRARKREPKWADEPLADTSDIDLMKQQLAFLIKQAKKTKKKPRSTVVQIQQPAPVEKPVPNSNEASTLASKLPVKF